MRIMCGSSELHCLSLACSQRGPKLANDIGLVTEFFLL